MHTIFLTGGIASGKSAVSQVFQERGIPVIDADVIARKVVKPGTSAHARLRAEFGPTFFDAHGNLLRKKLADVVFEDVEKRRRLNAITHPAVRWEIAKQYLQALFQGANICLLDIPLLFESDVWKWWPLSTVCLVHCSPGQQMARLMARDGCTREQAEARINAQMPIEEQKRHAELLIDNSGRREELVEKAITIIDRYERSLVPFYVRGVFFLLLLTSVWYFLNLKILCLLNFVIFLL
ncbi:unnamed protein product, partial [Mesorhabditis spiculigera]